MHTLCQSALSNIHFLEQCMESATSTWERESKAAGIEVMKALNSLSPDTRFPVIINDSEPERLTLNEMGIRKIDKVIKASRYDCVKGRLAITILPDESKPNTTFTLLLDNDYNTSEAYRVNLALEKTDFRAAAEEMESIPFYEKNCREKTNLFLSHTSPRYQKKYPDVAKAIAKWGETK